MSKVRLCPLLDLKEGEPLRVELPNVDIAAVRMGDDVFAIEDVCSHANVPLSDGEVLVEDGVCTIECIYHGSRFSLITGEPTNLPATEPVPVYPVEIVDDIVYVELENG